MIDEPRTQAVTLSIGSSGQASADMPALDLRYILVQEISGQSSIQEGWDVFVGGQHIGLADQRGRRWVIPGRLPGSKIEARARNGTDLGTLVLLFSNFPIEGGSGTVIGESVAGLQVGGVADRADADDDPWWTGRTPAYVDHAAGGPVLAVAPFGYYPGVPEFRAMLTGSRATQWQSQATRTYMDFPNSALAADEVLQVHRIHLWAEGGIDETFEFFRLDQALTRTEIWDGGSSGGAFANGQGFPISGEKEISFGGDGVALPVGERLSIRSTNLNTAGTSPKVAAMVEYTIVPPPAGIL